MRPIALLSILLICFAAGCEEEPEPPAPTVDGVDVLFVVDSSNSMESHQLGLQANAAALIDVLDAAGTDYQIGVTTTQARPCDQDSSAFADCEDADGTAGRLRGLDNSGSDVSAPPTIVEPGSPTRAADLAGLFDIGTAGATDEYGLAVAALAACASLDLPYTTDFDGWQTDDVFSCSGGSWDSGDPWYELCHCLPPGWEGYNTSDHGVPLLRPNKALVVVFVTDEGDYTPSAGSPGPWPWDYAGCQIGAPWPQSVQDQCAADPESICENECKLERFRQFFATLGRPSYFVTLGPDASFDADYEVVWPCNDVAESIPMIEWYLYSAELTGAPYLPLSSWTGDCFAEPDYEDLLTRVGEFIAAIS